MSKKNPAIEAARLALYVVSPTLARLIEVTTDSVNEAEEAAEHKDISGLRAEAQRQELKMQMAERQAKK